MKRAPHFIGLLALATLLGAAAPESGSQTLMTLSRAYYMASSMTASGVMGDLQFGNNAAGFSNLKGRMDLSVSGVLPESGDARLSGAVIFRITNAEAYRALNMQSDVCGGHALKWMAVHPIADSANKAIWISLFHSDDIHNAGPDALCQQSVYTPRQADAERLSQARVDYFMNQMVPNPK